ncbi:MAG: 2-oxoacid:acceptor oxidoreductase family protein [Spirochaetia bacterium]|nr:2-oxoacid:acceptor oxidoreductase family protein [Spirochaetia bacterium]
MYRIRLHGRGGQGIKTAGRILGEALFLEKYEVQDAPRYGAERRGAPIFSYVRAGKKPINERGIILHPGLVVVADETLIEIPAAGVFQGIAENTVFFICSNESSDFWRKRLGIDSQIITLSQSEEYDTALDFHYNSSVCVGAAGRLLGVISKESLKQAIEEELSVFEKTVIEKNIEISLKAYDELSSYEGIVKRGVGISADSYRRLNWVEPPFEGADISAPAIYDSGTSELALTGLWRTLRPVVNKELCALCWHLCGSFCPDSAIYLDEDGAPQIDYEHCKGCLICVMQCPRRAISVEAEHKKTKEAKGA